jgi:excisionase family DNA binding protein
MQTLNEIKRPSKAEQLLALKSYTPLITALDNLKSDRTEIEIEETGGKITIPKRALSLLGQILKAMSQGNPISIVPIATEVTTQSAAEMLSCSRPHLIKILEEGKIPFTKVGKHRRIMFEDVLKYKQQMKEAQKQHIIEIMTADEESGLYDT